MASEHRFGENVPVCVELSHSPQARTTPMVSANKEITFMAFGLTAAQKLFYDDNGYLVVRGVLPREETLMYRQELHDLSARLHSTSARVDVTWSSVQQQEPAKL